MDLFKDCLNNTINLDDVSIYPEEWKEMNIHDFFSKCMDKAGHSLFYMDFLHPSFGEGSQKQRVEVLCQELSDMWHFSRNYTSTDDIANYRLSLMKWLYRFEDEVENQC